MEWPETWAWDIHDMIVFDDEAEQAVAERTRKMRSPEGQKLWDAITDLENVLFVQDDEGRKVMPDIFS